MGLSSAPKPTLQSAWNLFVVHWRTYLALQLTVLALALVSVAVSLLITVIAVAVTAGVSADLRESVTQLVSSLLNLRHHQITTWALLELLRLLLRASPAGVHVFDARSGHRKLGMAAVAIRVESFFFFFIFFLFFFRM